MPMVKAPPPQKYWPAEYKNDWVSFAEKILGVNLYSKQKDILRLIQDNRKVAVRSANGCGKTFVAAVSGLCFLYTRPGSQVILTAPNYDQAKNVLFSEVQSVMAMGADKILGGAIQDTQIKIRADWMMRIISPKDETRAKGIHSNAGVYVICDEAIGIDIKILEALSTIVLDDCKCLEISNPQTRNSRFYERFTTDSGWKTEHMSAFHTPAFTGEEVVIPGLTTPTNVDDWEKEYGKDSAFWSHAVLGEFPDQSITQLISLEEVEAAMGRPDTMTPTHTRHLGIDSAGQGDDMTVVVMRAGNKVKVLHEEYKTDEVRLAGTVMALIREYQIDGTVFMDGTGGWGRGTASLLKDEGINVVDVPFGGSPVRDDTMFNRRAELYWNLRRWVREEAELSDIPERMKADLIGIEYYNDRKGKLRIEEKDEIKKRIGRSPDHADSLALTMAAESTINSSVLMNVNAALVSDTYERIR